MEDRQRVTTNNIHYGSSFDPWFRLATMTLLHFHDLYIVYIELNSDQNIDNFQNISQYFIKKELLV